LSYKTFEVVWPDEWNALIDALNELSTSIGLVIGVAKTLEFGYGLYKNVLPFSGEIDAPYGMLIPVYLNARVFSCHVLENTLDGTAYVILRKNEEETFMRIEIPSENIGTNIISTSELIYNPGDRLDFIVDTTDASSGLLKIGSIVCVSFYVLPP